MSTVSYETERYEIQEKADARLRLFNESAPRCLEGETTKGYRRRLATKLQRHAPGLQDVNVYDANGAAFDLIERQIYEAAEKEAKRPTLIPAGELREVKKIDQTGREFSDFYGSPKAWMSTFMAEPKRLAGIRTETQRGYHMNG